MVSSVVSRGSPLRGCLAITTTSVGARNHWGFVRNASRTIRRMRLRCTAPPTLRLTVTPRRGDAASAFRTYTMKCFVKSRRPFCRVATNW